MFRIAVMTLETNVNVYEKIHAVLNVCADICDAAQPLPPPHS